MVVVVGLTAPAQGEPAADLPAVTPLLSEQWFRIAGLRPSLRADVQIDRVTYRGQPWGVLSSPDGSRRARLNEAAYAFVGRCDGRHSVQALWEVLLAERQDDAPTQDELIALVLPLYRDGFLAFAGTPDFGLLLPAHRLQPQAAPQQGNSLLAWRLPLGSPERWLDPLLPLARHLFSAPMFVAWCLLVAAGAVAAWQQQPLWGEFLARSLGTPHVMALSWVCFVLMKALHEAGHGLCLRRFGGRVPQWGLTLLALTPVPYVDASAANAFASPRHRLLVSSAGALVELALAAAAILASLALQPGLALDLCLVVFVIGALSSLLVNANPLLRFDGYYALTDALELPNLAQRSAQHWLGLGQQALGLRTVPPPAATWRENAWVWAYAPASWVCRLVMALALLAWVGRWSFWLGVALALYFVWSLAAVPVMRGLRFLWSLGLEPRQAQRARGRAGLAAAALAALAVGLPLPDATVARGVVWLPDEAAVRADTAGFVEQALVAEGQAVEAGELLFVLSNPALEAELAGLRSRIAQLHVEQHAAMDTEPARARRAALEQASQQAAHDRLAQRIAGLRLRAAVSGTVSTQGLRPADWPGRHVEQGAVMAYLVPQAGVDLQRVASAAALALPPAGANPVQPTVRVALPQDQAAWLRDSAAPSVSVFLGGLSPVVVSARLLRDATAITQELPTAALGDRFGGPIVTDPADASGRTAARGVVWLDVALPAADPAPAIGTRVWVRLDRGSRPAAALLARWVQQAVLVHFNPDR